MFLHVGKRKKSLEEKVEVFSSSNTAILQLLKKRGFGANLHAGVATQRKKKEKRKKNNKTEKKRNKIFYQHGFIRDFEVEGHMSRTAGGG